MAGFFRLPRQCCSFLPGLSRALITAAPEHPPCNRLPRIAEVRAYVKKSSGDEGKCSPPPFCFLFARYINSLLCMYIPSAATVDFVQVQ